MASNSIPDDVVFSTCKPGKGAETCRYLAMGSEGFECLKKTDLKWNLDARVAADNIVARGDNCEGR